MSREFRFVHFSDIHFGQEAGIVHGPHQSVRREIIRSQNRVPFNRTVLKLLLIFIADWSVSPLRCLIGPVACASAILTCTAVGAFFEWRFSEVFSNADGSVQFIELRSQGADEGQASGAQIRSTSTGKKLSLTENLSGTTLNKKFLLATVGFGSLPGAVAPNFLTTPLPAGFFNPNGDTLTLTHHVTIDSRAFPAIPIDGVTSVHFPAGNFATNTPTNFSDQWGSINLSANFGDYNDNGTVDAADYAAYRKYLDTPTDTTNIIHNDETPGWVMTDDYDVWHRRFGTSSTGGAGPSAVPEPSCCVISILMGAMTLVLRRSAARLQIRVLSKPPTCRRLR